MFVAELKITDGSGLWTVRDHIVSFTDLDRAKAEYVRLKGLMDDKLARKNDLPDSVEVIGDGVTFSMAVSDIKSVTMLDLSVLNRNSKGTREEFPDLFRKSPDQETT